MARLERLHLHRPLHRQCHPGLEKGARD
jgi:hypothetical protein